MTTLRVQVLIVGKDDEEAQRIRDACVLEGFESLQIAAVSEIPSREEFDPSIVVLSSSLSLDVIGDFVSRASNYPRHVLMVDEQGWQKALQSKPLGAILCTASPEEIRFRLREALDRREALQLARIGSPTMTRSAAWELLPSADWVTGLDNRVRFLQEMKKNLSRARRYKRPFCCILANFSNIDALMDSLGEEEVNDIFEDVAGMLEMSIRDADALARIQQDTFGLLLTETDLPNAQVVIDRIAQRIRDYSKTRGLRPAMLFSFGVSAFMGESSTIDSMLEDARKALKVPEALEHLQA